MDYNGDSKMTIFLICLIIGIFLGRIGVLTYGIDGVVMWYQNKYGKFTPGDGRNYLQIFKISVAL